jgi:methanogen homocitrate synthase
MFATAPSFTGRKGNFVLGKKSGKASIEIKIKELSLKPITDNQSKEILNRVKKLGIEKKGLLNDEEFKTIYKEICG